MAKLISFTRASTGDVAWIDPNAVTLMISTRPDVTRLYLGAEEHSVDVKGTLEEVEQEINGARI